ncbi:MAG: hypothetical protein HIU85_09345 [Proteobacteria bacterium]|nr:hypothetical protein [Pseudomonadota bacterium]
MKARRAAASQRMAFADRSLRADRNDGRPMQRDTPMRTQPNYRHSDQHPGRGNGRQRRQGGQDERGHQTTKEPVRIVASPFAQAWIGGTERSLNPAGPRRAEDGPA